VLNNHVLYVAWGFPPSRAGGVYRALATANLLAESGYRVTVLTADEESWAKYTGSDYSLMPKIDPRIKVIRIPFVWLSLDSNLHAYNWFRITFPRIWNKLKNRKLRRIFPENNYGFWRESLENAALKINEQDPVGLTLVTSNPNVTATAALALHQESNVPFVVDHRDAWTLDVFDGTTLYDPNSTQGKWEQKIFSKASAIWFVNEPIANWHSQKYPQFADKIEVVENGWDPMFINQNDLTHHLHKPLRFGYLGTISGKVPVKEFLESWNYAKSKYASMSSSEADIYGYLGYYGTHNPETRDLFEASTENNVTFKGSAQKAKVTEIYNEWDVCLLILGTGKYVTSGKVYEYLAVGKPIVSVHDPGNAASQVLRGYPMWFPAKSLSTEDIAEALNKAAVAAINQEPEVKNRCLEFSTKYRRDVVMRNAIEKLRFFGDSNE
jgi:glycosyltransferase involved in cell wall biosynthesis